MLNKLKLLIYAFGIAMLVIGLYTFFQINNDHIECETVVEKSKSQNGIIVTVERHICKERFSL